MTTRMWGSVIRSLAVARRSTRSPRSCVVAMLVQWSISSTMTLTLRGSSGCVMGSLRWRRREHREKALRITVDAPRGGDRVLVPAACAVGLLCSEQSGVDVGVDVGVHGGVVAVVHRVVGVHRTVVVAVVHRVVGVHRIVVVVA